MVHLAIFLAIVLAALPFYTLTLSPLIFIYPTFLFLSIRDKKLSFFAIALLAFATALLEYLAVIDALILMAPNKNLALIPAALLILYVASYSSIWLFYTQKYLPKRSVGYQLGFWTISFFLYLLFKDQAQFVIFGQLQGFLFCNPLLPLSYYPLLSAPLWLMPQWMALLWFALATSLLSWLFIAPSRLPALVAVALAILWIALPRQPSCPPAWLCTIGHLPITISANASLEPTSAMLAYQLGKLKQQFPSLTTIILPESAWNSGNLSQRPTLTMLQNNPIPNLLIGSFLIDQNGCYNTVYQYHKGQLASQSSKRHTLPLTERPIPLPFCTDLYFQKSSPLTASKEPKPLINLDNPKLSAVIYICSELFFNTYPDDPYQCTIIAVANDWWFRMPHFCWLMANAARMRAMQWKRGIIYVSYKHAYYFDTAGKSFPLITCSQSRLFNF